MCTRYFMDDTASELSDIISAAKASSLSDKYIKRGKPLITNGEIRPTDVVPVIAPNPKGIGTIYPMKWGYTNPEHKSTIFNARIESASTKPTFKKDWESHRCIVPASYYFEWEHLKSSDGKIKTGDKYIIQPPGESVTWLCGLYRIEDSLPVFVILTREPGEQIKHIHDRMPLILPYDRVDEWINPHSDPSHLLQYALTDMFAEKT